MVDRFKRNSLFQLVVLFCLWILLLFFFPVAISFRDLYKGEQLAIQGESYQAAQYLFRASRGLFWQKQKLMVQAGKLALQAKQPQFSVEILRPLYVHQQLSNDGRFVLAQAYYALGDNTVADQLCQALADNGYLSLIIYPTLLEHYLHSHQYASAQMVLQRLMRLQPGNLDWQYRDTLISFTLQPRAAIPQLKQIAGKGTPYHDRITTLLAPFEQSHNQDDAYLFLQAGRGLASINEWLLAEEAFRQAVSTRSDYAEAWAYYGIAKFYNAFPGLPQNNTTKNEESSLMSYESAYHPQRWLRDHSGLAEIRNALWLKPDSQVALVFESHYWLERGYPQIALRSATQAVNIYPKDEAVLENYAQVLAQNGALESAWQVYHEILQNTNHKSTATKSLLRFDIQFNYQLWEEALPLARTLSYQNPGDGDSLDLLAQVLFALHYNSRAKEILERVIQSDPNYPAAHLHLAVILISEGKTYQAVAELQRTRTLAANDSIGEQALRLLLYYAP